MKTRLVFVSLAFGIVASQVLAIIFKDIWPGYISIHFETGQTDPAFAWFGYGIATILMLVSGYTSARLEWAQEWNESLLHGAGSGFLAGCLAYLLSGASAASGIMGQNEILLSTLRLMRSEEEGIQILARGIVTNALWTNGLFVFIVASATILGGLGGLLSMMETSQGWSTPPARKSPYMYRIVISMFGSFAVANLLLLQTTFDVLAKTTLDSLAGRSVELPGMLLPVSTITTLPTIINLTMISICGAFFLWWVLHDWQIPEERFHQKTAITIFVILMLAFYLSSSKTALITTGILTIAGLIVWAIWRLQPVTSEIQPLPPIQPYNGFDVLAAALSQAVTIVALVSGSTISFTLSLVLIAVVNVSHLTANAAPESTAQQQITSLYRLMDSTNLTLITVSSVAGFIAIGTILWAGVLRPASRKSQVEIPTYE